MELFENLAYEIGDMLYKKNHPILKQARGYVDNQASNFLAQGIIDKVKSHAKVVSLAGVASAIPGGELASGGAIIASTWKMYYDINKLLGVSFSDNFLKSVASGIVGNLASNGLAFAATAVVNKIPIIGQVAGLAAGPAINRTALYTAAYSYLSILKQVLDYGDVTEDAFNMVMSGGSPSSSRSRSNSSSGSRNAEIVRHIIADTLGVSFNSVRPESRFVEDLGADSLDAIEIIMQIENHFNIEIPDDVAQNISTVHEAIRLVEVYTS